MKRLLSLVAFFATLQASAQQVNPVPDYVFRNQMSVGRGTVTDTAAYFSIGPRYGATKGFMPPIVGDTATFSSGKRNGLLIFSVQKNKFLYWDSVRVQWSDMAGSSGTYITGTGITGYVPQFSGTTTIDTSALYTLGSRLGIGTTSFAYTSATSSIELNGTSGGILGFKRNDSARGYLWHTGSDMELANTVAGAISFNTNSSTRGSISSAGVWRLHNLAGTGDRVVVASSNGTLSASTSVTGLVDTTTISTRAWRQKGDDSLGAIIATKGSGTVTSVATGYGLSGGTITTTGTLLVDTLNISTRAWRQKGLDSLAALEVSGSGTTNYIPKFTAATTIGNSQIFDNGTNVGIGTASPGSILDVRSTGYNIIRSTGGNGGYFDAYNTSGTRLASFGAESGGDVYFGSRGSSPVIAITNSTERLRITSGGDIGFGTTSPTQKFHVSSASNTAILAQSTTTFPLFVLTNNNGVSWNLEGGRTSNSFGIYQSAGAGSGTTYFNIRENGRVGVNTTTDAGYQFDINGTLRSVNGANFATTSGNVGIGTASPTNLLTLIAAATNKGIDFVSYASPSTVVGSINFEQTNDIMSITQKSSFAAGALTFGTNSTERLRINSAGEVLINTTTDAGDYKLQVSGNIYNTGSAVFAATSGNVGIGTASPSANAKLHIVGSNAIIYTQPSADDGQLNGINMLSLNGVVRAGLTLNTSSGELRLNSNAGYFPTFYSNGAEAMRISTSGELLINTTTDAGDYKLQVVGNARVGTGKLDIASNTTYGLGVSRSGTSEVAGQIYNSSGILYTGVESSAGGAIFSGSSAYAAVIGSGAAYPLQFATNNVTRATINTNGELLINTTTDNGDFKLQVNGNALISGSIKTANGASSTAQPWHLGSVVATNVQLDTANYVEVEINGVYYRLAIVTPL